MVITSNLDDNKLQLCLEYIFLNTSWKQYLFMDNLIICRVQVGFFSRKVWCYLDLSGRVWKCECLYNALIETLTEDLTCRRSNTASQILTLMLYSWIIIDIVHSLGVKYPPWHHGNLVPCMCHIMDKKPKTIFSLSLLPSCTLMAIILSA